MSSHCFLSQAVWSSHFQPFVVKDHAPHVGLAVHLCLQSQALLPQTFCRIRNREAKSNNTFVRAARTPFGLWACLQAIMSNLVVMDGPESIGLPNSRRVYVQAMTFLVMMLVPASSSRITAELISAVISGAEQVRWRIVTWIRGSMQRALLNGRYSTPCDDGVPVAFRARRVSATSGPICGAAEGRASTEIDAAKRRAEWRNRTSACRSLLGNLFPRCAAGDASPLPEVYIVAEEMPKNPPGECYCNLAKMKCTLFSKCFLCFFFFKYGKLWSRAVACYLRVFNNFGDLLRCLLRCGAKLIVVRSRVISIWPDSYRISR